MICHIFHSENVINMIFLQESYEAETDQFMPSVVDKFEEIWGVSFSLEAG